MNDSTDQKPGMVFYVLAGVFLVWNLIGLMFYYQQMTLTPEIMQSQGLTADQMAWIEATPVWANAAYAIAVTAGVLASLLLLMRKRLAIPLYILSFVCIIIQDIESFVLRNPSDAWGGGAYAIPVMVFVIAIVEIWYSRSANAKGWLT